MPLNLRQKLYNVYSRRAQLLRGAAGALVVIAYGVVMAMTAHRALTESSPVPSRSWDPFPATMEPIDAGNSPVARQDRTYKPARSRLTSPRADLRADLGRVPGLARSADGLTDRAGICPGAAEPTHGNRVTSAEPPFDQTLLQETRFGENPAGATRHPWPHTGEIVSWPSSLPQSCGPSGAVQAEM